MTSTRLPGKVLMDLEGAPMLRRQFDRLKRCATADAVVLACTDTAADDGLAELAAGWGMTVFRGSENDVLSRYLGAARASNADVIVRVTSDCPIICPEICDEVVESLGGSDYASNTLVRTYPRGLDCEAFTMAALEKTAAEADSQAAREHVTWHMFADAGTEFNLRSVAATDNHSGLRWTVDEMADLEAVRRLWSGLSLSQNILGYREILAYALKHPEIGEINASVAQKKP